MDLHAVLILFQIVVLLFAISLHEAAHAWMASRLGDPTARMLGRVTLNPLRHIDMFGTVLVPLLCVYSGFPLIGWAKPTPVTTRNFKNIRRDDILTTLAGPVSNLITAVVALLVLLVLKHFNVRVVASVVMGMITPDIMNSAPVLFPLSLLLYYAVLLNLVLMAFNLIPLPPLDGSHVLRHMLPYNWLRAYDSIGMIGLVLIFLFGGRFISMLVSPVLGVFNQILLRM